MTTTHSSTGAAALAPTTISISASSASAVAAVVVVVVVARPPRLAPEADEGGSEWRRLLEPSPPPPQLSPQLPMFEIDPLDLGGRFTNFGQTLSIAFFLFRSRLHLFDSEYDSVHDLHTKSFDSLSRHQLQMLLNAKSHE
jgi:hypothetical protein